MGSFSDKISNAFTWPEFRIFWLLFVCLMAAFVINIFIVPLEVLVFEGLIFITIAAFAFVAVYRGAAMRRQTAIEHNELEGIMKSVVDGLMVYDDRFKITFWNPAAARIFKIEAKAALGHVITPQDMQRAGWQGLAQTVFPTLAPRITFQSKEGESPQVVDLSLSEPELELRVITAPVLDAHGRNTSFIKIIHDRTPQIAALRSNTEFITVASHQLRGPVTDISWALQSIAGDENLSESIRPIAENALAASKNLVRRIEDLLDVARIEEGKVGYVFEEADVAEFVGTVLAGVLPAARKAGVKIYFDRPSETLPRVTIDAKRLAIALTNLLENAIRYNVENGEVIVRVDRVPGKPFVEVSVKDTGIGIPPEALPKLFVKFFRADNAVQSQTEGSGLGLYIARSIVRAHGGEIRAESEQNRGAILTFTLPTDPALVPKGEIGPEGFLL